MVDILVVGSGIAGLSTAITAKQKGASVVVATKSGVSVGNSVMAQGGMNVALANVSSDSVESHIEDTIKSSHNLANLKMVEKMCKGGIEAANFLEQLGVPFSRIDGASSPLKSIAQRKLGGTSATRACYAQDYTGLKILQTLIDSAINLAIPIKERLFLLEIIKDSQDRACGGVFLNIDSGEIVPIYAKRVVVATGGFGAIFSKNTNSKTSTGDGIAAIFRAGGELSNLEFIQFHPTTLKGSNILISESARGAGGYLVNSEGKRFVDELATRDVVVKAEFKQIMQGKSVYLDLRHIGKERLQSLMPQELKLIKQYAKVDATSELIEIEPAVHYTMGGVSVKENLEVIGLKNCFCVGEASNAKVHGANRLGGNSLLEAVSFGMLCAKEALSVDGANYTQYLPTLTLPIKPNSDNFKIIKAKKSLSRLLFEKVGIVRNEDRLKEAQKELQELNIDTLTIDDTPKSSTLLVDLLELKNASILAKALISSALWRKESRGSHIRSDYPQQMQEFAVNSKICYN